MKKRMLDRKWVTIPALVVVLVALMAGGAFAAVQFTVDLPTHVMVVGPASSSYAIGVFSDPGCTDMIAKIDWGGVEQGTVVERIVWVKNLGDEIVSVTVSTDAAASAAGLVLSASVLSLAPDSSGPVVLVLDATHATAADLNFVVTFASNSVDLE